MKKLLQKLALMVAGLLFALLVAESGVRLLGLAPEVAPVERGRFRLSDNPRLVYEPVPALSHQGSEVFFEYSGTSNSLGYRDREHPVEKSPGVTRIAVLGDSIAAGWGVEETANAFPARLEELLRAEGHRVEVMNFGVSGYNTAQEVETLEARALRFAPDVVLLAFCLNDIRPPDPRIVAALEAAGEQQGHLPPAVARESQRLLMASALYRTLAFGPVRPEAAEAAAARAAEAPRPDDVTPERDWVGPAFERLARIARREELEVAVVVFPYLRQLYRYPEGKARLHERVERLAQRHGFAHLDLLDTFQECAADTDGPIDFDRYHPTAAGHACAAAAMAGFLDETLL